ncbi:MAG: hypothetical protein ABI282_06130 [Candidatus Baltobacteraceae bacterium]
MKMRDIFPGLLLGAATLALAACNSNNGGGGLVGPTPGPTCGPAGLSSQMVYPLPGATNVPDTTTELVIAVSTPLANNTYNLALTGTNNFSSQTGNPLAQISASQLPAGSGPTTIVNPTYEAVSLINSLPAATQISLFLNIPNDPNNCTPQTIPGASFTTQ